MKRRTFLASAGTGVSLLAGCSGGDGGGGGTTTTTEAGTTEAGTTTGTATPAERTLTVGTYSVFVEKEDSPGQWLKRAFEEEHDNVTVEYKTPDSEINYYLQRARQGADIDTDLYFGLSIDDLIRADTNLDQPLFTSVQDQIAGAENIKEYFRFGPGGRVLTYDAGYISLVYDEERVAEPTTFDSLLEDQYSGELLLQNAQYSDTGRLFLLWSIYNKGEDAYLDYWKKLQDNGARILQDWSTSYYSTYMEGEGSVIVSYSTDQVYANRFDYDMSRHQIAFLENQGYALPEGMAQFQSTDNPELGRQFMEFTLQPDVQGEIAVRNVVFPATTNANLPESFGEYAKEPENPIMFDYDDLKGNVEGWVEEWARQIATN